jgi:hypothetical protein
MRGLIVGTLDFSCFLLVILLSLSGLIVGTHAGSLGLGILLGVCGFIVGSLIAGTILAIIEIAKNTRKMTMLLEQQLGSLSIIDKNEMGTR